VGLGLEALINAMFNILFSFGEENKMQEIVTMIAFLFI
jgi:hypothetical protein